MPLAGLPFSVRARRRDGIAILELAGKIMGSGDADVLRRAIVAALAEGADHVLLDFRGVPWVNSQGIGVLMSCATNLRPEGGAIKLLGVNDRVRSVLDVTRLSVHFEFFDDEERAVARCAIGPTDPD